MCVSFGLGIYLECCLRVKLEILGVGFSFLSFFIYFFVGGGGVFFVCVSSSSII